MQRLSVCGLCLLGGLAVAVAGSHAEPVPVPEGYRLSAYRAPTPAVLPGASVLDTAGLQSLLMASQPVLLDVMASGQVALPDGGWRWVPDKPRRHLPGSMWLPNVGRGELDAGLESYFRRALARVSAGDVQRPLVFYCLRDCWMSWNAGKRALAYGYRKVYWYPAGSDGWAEAGLPLVDAEPLAP